MAMLRWKSLKAVNNQNNLIIIGAGGHGKVAADCARAMGQFDTIRFLDAEYPNFCEVADWDIIGSPDQFENFSDERTCYFIAIGHNSTRAKWQAKVIESGARICTLIHPSACIAPQVIIGRGTLVLAKVVVNVATSIGEGCIINTAATVDHDCSLGEFSHLAPGVSLAGAVKLGVEVFIGIGSNIIQCLSIGDKSTIGAGSTVLENIPANVTAVGTPAKVIKKHDS